MIKNTLKLVLGYYVGYYLGWVGIFLTLAFIGGLL
jgi:hypothetical protein